MINTEILEHAVKLALYSPMIKKEKGVSIIIVAPPEHGKTEILKKYQNISTNFVTSDFNTFIFADFVREYESGLKTTITIPDFLRAVKKKYSSQSNILTTLNTITEEGWTGTLALGQKVKNPIKANVLTSITKDEIMDKRFRWTSMGFMSRFIPLSYSYKEQTKDGIRDYIKSRNYISDDPYDFSIPREKVDITLPRQIAIEIEDLSKYIAREINSQNFTGFRTQRQLQTLAMASALSNQRTMVNNDDLEVVREISKFINFDFKKI